MDGRAAMCTFAKLRNFDISMVRRGTNDRGRTKSQDCSAAMGTSVKFSKIEFRTVWLLPKEVSIADDQKGEIAHVDQITL